MNNNHRKNGKPEETSGISQKFDLYIKRLINARVRNAWYRHIRERDRVVILPLETIEDLFPRQFEFRMDLRKVCLGNTVIYIRDEKLADALNELDVRHKRIMELSFICGYTVAEVARELGIKKENVMQYKWETIRELREKMEGESHGKQ